MKGSNLNMNKDELDLLMESRGFTRWATINNGQKVIYVSDPSRIQNPDLAVSCTVTTDTREFLLEYKVPKSLLNLKLGTCAPVDDDKFFNNKLEMINRGVKVLAMEFSN